MLILFFHGSSGISKLTKKYMRFLSNFGTVLCEESKPLLVYKTDAKKYLKNKKKYEKIYKLVAKHRKKQVEDLVNLLKVPVIAVGISEGGIGVTLANSKYIKKKIIIGYTGECNYFTRMKQPIKMPYIKHLFLVGEKDQFFSNKHTSVSSVVSRNTNTCSVKGRPYPYKNVISYKLKNKKHNVYSCKAKQIIKNFLFA